MGKNLLIIVATAVLLFTNCTTQKSLKVQSPKLRKTETEVSKISKPNIDVEAISSTVVVTPDMIEEVRARIANRKR
jgi:hypothetical protein